MDYSYVRGFGVHGDWCKNGIEEWLYFDKERYAELIKAGKEKFPGMNTVRIRFSFDAYMMDRKKCLASIKTAGKILTDAGLAVIPTYFNGWFGVPSYGGFTRECVQKNQIPPYKACIKDMVEALKDTNVLMHDIANEPFNNVYGNPVIFQDIVYFLKTMIDVVRSIDDRKITVGTQSYPNHEHKEICDIDQLAPLVDVISLHPYNMFGAPKEQFEHEFVSILEYIKQFHKPYIITECVWSAPTAEERLPYLESELEVYNKYHVGYLAHGLFTSPVADLHPVERSGLEKGLYMAFLDDHLEIRKHHDIFNQYAK